MRDSRVCESYCQSRLLICVDRVAESNRVGPCVLLIILLLAVSCGISLGQQAKPRDFSKETARSIPAWVRDGVIYEIFPRSFSASGDFKGITARLDELK